MRARTQRPVWVEFASDGGALVGVLDAPGTEFARAVDGSVVAYQVIGDGAVDVLVTRGSNFPVDMMWEEPRVVRFLDRMSSFARHMWFDPRGTGASDRIRHEDSRLNECVVDDMVAVLDAVGCERVALVGLGIPLGLLFAATYPDRTAALVLADSTARIRRADDYPEGAPDATVRDYQDEVRTTPFLVRERLAPSLVQDAEFRCWYERAQRLTCPPGERMWRLLGALETDLREVLGLVRVPTLIISHLDRGPAAQSRYLADHIQGAKAVEVPGADVMPFAPDSVALLDAVEEFLTGRLPQVQLDRVLATVLFTDIVNSTGQAASMGDRRWRELLASHDSLVRREVERFRGRAVKSTGDGFLATFDGPARAIHCACAIRDDVHRIGLEIRAGLHCGEIELHDEDVAGISVHIGERVASLAGPNQVLVSRTVVDLLAGSDIAFWDYGDHELKGVPGAWRVFEVRD
jgi:class 3 adenylate cyclase